jgi:hypothetical protein
MEPGKLAPRSGSARSWASPVACAVSSFYLPGHIYNFHLNFYRRSVSQYYRVHVETSYRSSPRFKEHFRLSNADFRQVVIEKTRVDVVREGVGSIVLR